jgi:hypothetical protein|tara:strand:- start:1569 stop:1904 length:336 start_codon:yes stop_codon:yes gene_type:complete
MDQKLNQTGRSESRPVREDAQDSRRKALAKLGLTALVAYSVPTLVRIDRSANAQVLPSPCPPPGSGLPRPNYCPPDSGDPGGGPPGGSSPPGGGPPGAGGFSGQSGASGDG